MSEELEPCPFCGAPAELVTAYKGNTVARCADIDCAGHVSDKALRDDYSGFGGAGTAVDAWNRRAMVAAAPAVQSEPVAWQPDEIDSALIKLALVQLLTDAYSRAIEAAQDKSGRFFQPGDADKYLADAKHAEQILGAMGETRFLHPPAPDAPAAPAAPAVQAGKSHNLIAVDRGALQLALNALLRNAEERGFTVQGEIADELQKSARTIAPDAPEVQAEPVAHHDFRHYSGTLFRHCARCGEIDVPGTINATCQTSRPPADMADKLAEALRGFIKYAEDCNDDSLELDKARAALAEWEQKGGAV